jgi:small subunit ribosomal protein S2
MARYIHEERNGIHIIDLRKTVRGLEVACRFVYKTTSNGGDVMFVGTKKQARESICEEATRVSSPYVSERWLGGMLTNHQTIRESIKKLADIEKMEEDGTINLRPKKEILKLRKLAERLTRNLLGIKNMKSLPKALVIVDIKKESIALKEARILGIPVIGLVDTNCNPDGVDICVPSNDDAIKAVRLIVHAISEAASKGKSIYAEVERVAVEKKAEEEALRQALEETKAKAKAAAAEETNAKAKVVAEEKAKAKVKVVVDGKAKKEVKSSKVQASPNKVVEKKVSAKAKQVEKLEVLSKKDVILAEKKEHTPPIKEKTGE